MIFLRKYSFASSTSDVIMKEILKLNEEEFSNLNFDYDSYKVMQKYLSYSTVLDSWGKWCARWFAFRNYGHMLSRLIWNRMQKNKIENALNSIGKNERDVTCYGHLKSTCNAIMSHGEKLYYHIHLKKYWEKNW